MTEAGYHSLDHHEYSLDDMRMRSARFYDEIRRRRSVRQFSNRPVPVDIIENCLRSAASAPSGANLQPWRFVVVSDGDVKRRIRMAAEDVEREFYSKTATRKWVEALEPLGTHASKPFLESAPYLIVIFALRYGFFPDGRKRKHYYVSESVGIATGLLIAALHHAGLVSLTYTPSKMGFLNRILHRPSNEKPYMILVAGYPAEDAVVPVIEKGALEEIVIHV